MDQDKPMLSRRRFLQIGGSTVILALGGSCFPSLYTRDQQKAYAATITIPSAFANRMPSDKALLAMNKNTLASVSWSGVTGKKVTSTIKPNTDLLLIKKGSSTKQNTYSDFLDLKFKNIGSIGGRSLDASVHFDKLTIGARADIKTTDGEDTTNNFTCIAVLSDSLIAIGTSATSDSPSYGYAFRGSRDTQVTVTVTWADTGAKVNLPFFAAISDIDAPSSLTNAWYREGWVADSGFSGTYWTWPSCYLVHSGNQFLSPGKGLTDGNDRWFKSGVIAPLSANSMTSTFKGGGCTTNLTLYSSYTSLTPPRKRVDNHCYVEGERVVFSVYQKMGSFFEDTMDCYTSLELVDILPPEVEYVKATLKDENDTNLIPQGTLAYNESTRELRFSFGKAWLGNNANYAGQELTWNIYCTARQPEKLKAVARNSSTTLFSGIAYESNEVAIPIIRSCTVEVTKRIRASELNWAHGDPTFVFVLKGHNQYGESRTYRSSVSFSESDSPDGDWLSKTIVMKAEPGDYYLSEEPCIRYQIDAIESDAPVSNNSVYLDLIELVQAKATFTNKKVSEEWLSDVTGVINHIGPAE